jgi:hypothetical protein
VILILTGCKNIILKHWSRILFQVLSNFMKA